MKVIATVVSVQGNVFARSANGSMRKLAAGDTLLQGEIIVAGADGHAELQMADGTRLAINAHESFQFGPETTQATAPDASEAAVLTDSRAATVIDPEQLLGDDPTAAALTGVENTGNSFVRLLRIVEPVTPLNFEFSFTPTASTLEPLGGVAGGNNNVAPAAVDDHYAMDEDGIVTLTPLSGDIDPDGGALRIVSINGTVLTPGIAQTIAVPNGTVNITATGVTTFTPASDFNGTVSFPYTISDGQGGTATANQIITVTPVNDPPVAVNDSYTMAEDGTAITLTPLTGDTDLDGDTLSVTSINGTVLTLGIAQTIAVPNGTVNITAAGVITFTPAPDFNGTVTFPYTISDGQGGTATANQIITVTPVNDPPVAINDSASTHNGQPVTVNVLGNDSDVDGDPLTIVGTSAASNGTVTINPDGSLTYVPNPGFSGTDTFTYTITDPSGATSTATVTVSVAPPVNLPPVANPDSATTPLDTPVTINVLGNDTDPESDPLTVTGASVPPAQGTVVVNPDGTVTFTPAAGFTGTATITYTISDGTNSATSTATVGVNAPVNLPPVANPDSATTPLDTPVTINVLGNDTDPESDPLTVTGASVPPAQGTVVVNPDGTVTFTPAAGFTGTATITYTISDGTNSATSTATVGVNAPVNLPPVANPDSATTPLDTPVTINVLGNDTDPESDPLTVTGASVPPAQGTVVVNPDGTVTFTPAAGFTGTATITYTISDGTNSATSTATVGVNAPVNLPPVANPDSATTPLDTPVTINVLGNDTDPESDPLTVTGASVPPAQGTVVVNPDGTVTFTPAAGFTGTATITYTISDGTNSATSTATVGVNAPVNLPPVANPDSATTPLDTPVTINVLGNDTDPESDPLTVTGASVPPAQGTVVVNPDGTVTFTPAAGFTGTATITYTISDGTNSATSTATVGVNAPVNLPPVANPDSATTPLDTPVTINVLGNDTDPESDPLTVTGASVPPAQGTVVVNPDGTVTFTPAAGFTGTATITYTISDGTNSATSTATVGVNAPVNLPPVANPDSATTPLDTPVTINVLGNDTDPESDPLTVTGASVPPAQGTVVVNPDGTVTFTPAAGFTGTATITYTISDGTNPRRAPRQSA